MRQQSELLHPNEFNYEELENRVALATDTIDAMSIDVQPASASPIPSQVMTDNALFLGYQQFAREAFEAANGPTSGSVIIINPTSFFQFDSQGNLIATGPSSSFTPGSTAVMNPAEPIALFADSGVNGFTIPSGSFALANVGLGQNQLGNDGFLLIYNGSALNDGMALFNTFTQTVSRANLNSNIQTTALSIPTTADMSLIQSPVVVSGIPSNIQIDVTAQMSGQPALPQTNIRPQAAASTKDKVIGSGTIQPSFAPLTLQRATMNLNDSIDSALKMADRIITGKPSFPPRVNYLRDSLPLPINAGISILRAVSNASEKAPSSSEYRPNLHVPPMIDQDAVDEHFAEFDETGDEFTDITSAMCLMSTTPFISSPRRRDRHCIIDNNSSKL